MALPPDKISELKNIIDSQLAQMNVDTYVRAVMEEMTNKQSSMNGLSEQDVIEMAQSRGIVDEIMKKMHFVGCAKSCMPVPKMEDENDAETSFNMREGIHPNKRYLYLQICGGKAFMDQLIDSNDESMLALHLHFRGQRFRSRAVSCCCEPTFEEGFLLELHKNEAGDAGRLADVSMMLSISDQVHIVVVKTSQVGDATLLSSHLLEWRPILASQHSAMNVSVELKGIGTESKVPVGILEMKLELFPRLTRYLEDGVVRAQLDLERSMAVELDRRFREYAKHWWAEYVTVRPTHKNRLVKIFALDENSNYRPVSSFVTPLRAGRLLDSPRQAMRFVNLIRFDRQQALGGGQKLEQWCALHAFLAKCNGDCENHATLLCSLLLGFGLDAYVCIGSKSVGAIHAWVLTFSVHGLITFWESLSGERYIHEPVDPMAPPMDKAHRAKYPYKTIGCVFNHQEFYANNQVSDRVEECRFELHHPSLWRSMSSEVLMSVSSPGSSSLSPSPPPLYGSSLDPIVASGEFELQLRRLVSQHRKDQGLITVWDDQLSYILNPALAAYELERVTGIPVGNEEFVDAIHQAVGEAQQFTAYPIQFTHHNARKAFLVCLRDSKCQLIVNCRGEDVKLALRVRIFPYPESACATWVMFASKCKSVT